jgi:hypothetical protein
VGRGAGQVPKALRQALAAAPGPPLSPVEYSLDAATGAIGILSSYGYVQPTLPTLAAFASCLQSSSVGDELLALGRLRACFPNESRAVRLGCATRGASRTGYLEAQGNGLRTYLHSLGADNLLRRATAVAASLGPGSRPEGVGVRLNGPDARRMKLYLPVRYSSPDRFRSTLRRYSSADWASLLLDTLALLYGAGDVFVGGRLMLTLATDRDLPGLTASLRRACPSDASLLVLLHVILARLGIDPAWLSRFATEHAHGSAWARTCRVRYVSVEPTDEGGGSRLRLWCPLNALISLPQRRRKVLTEG